MTSLLDFLPRARGLEVAPEVESLLEDLLGHILIVEGPPVEPIPGLSEDYRTEITRSDKGRPLCVSSTWTTGPWRCLLMETHSVAMGRGITLKADTTKTGQGGRERTILDSKSASFQKRVIRACHGLGINAPVGEGAVHTCFGSHRTFLAWRSREMDEPMNRGLRGDVDNFAKNILDGLQKAGVLPNDRGVHRLTAAKDLPESWLNAPPTLEEVLRQEAMARRSKGEPLETIRVEMRLSKAHLGRIFPDYRPAKATSPRTLQPGADLVAAKAAVELILGGAPYKEARKASGASGAALRKVLGEALLPEVLEGQVTIQALAQRLELDTRSVSAMFQDRPDAMEALQKAAKEVSKPTTKSEKAARLDRAVKDVLRERKEGEVAPTPAEAARAHGVNLGSLRSKLLRMTSKNKPVHPKKTKAKKPKKGAKG